MDDSTNNPYLQNVFTPYRLLHIERLLEHDIKALARTRRPEGPLVDSDGLDAIVQEAMQRTGTFLQCESPPCEYRLFEESAVVPARERINVLCGKATIGLPFALLAAGSPIAAVVAGVLSAGLFYFSHQIGTLNEEIAEIRIEKERLKYPSFNYKDRIITFIPETREGIFFSAVHEYTHFLQLLSAARLEIFLSGPLSEGHARGVTRNIMKTVWNGEPAWMHETYDKDVGELKSVYRWANQHHGRPMSEELLSAASTRDEEENYCLNNLGRPTNHAIGNAYFKMYEQDEGTGIYADIMRGPPDEKE